MFVGGSLDREDLLAMLERALSGGLLGAEDYEDLAGPEFDYDEDEEELDLEEEELEDEDEAEHDPIGPQTKMTTSSKGEEFLFVAHAMRRWLGNCPSGPLELGPEGGDPLSALVCCWSATVTHALAPEPLTLEELNRAVGILDSDIVEEHLEAMVRSGLAEARADPGEPRYALTGWGREGIAPIVAAVRYECHYPEPDVLPPDVFDAEAAFQMALPLLRLPPRLRGSCRLGVVIPGEEPLVAGATVEVDRGAVLAASPLLDREPETWATGSPLDWCETVVDPSTARLEVGGDVELAEALLAALHEKLFGSPRP